jgi:hypothetical protein
VPTLSHDKLNTKKYFRWRKCQHFVKKEGPPDLEIAHYIQDICNYQKARYIIFTMGWAYTSEFLLHFMKKNWSKTLSAESGNDSFNILLICGINTMEKRYRSLNTPDKMKPRMHRKILRHLWPDS